MSAPAWFGDLAAENITPRALETRLRLIAEAENMMRGNSLPLRILNQCAEDVRRAKENCRG